MRNEPHKYALSEAGRKLGRQLQDSGYVPVFDYSGRLIALIEPPIDPELTTFREWREQVIQEALIEDQRDGK